MPTSVLFNGTTYSIPKVGERLYGANVSTFLIAVGANALSKAGGTFTLTAEANFGATYGLVAKYLKSASSNIAATGVIRFANNEGLGWRNAANSADLALTVSAADVLTFGGLAIPAGTSIVTLTGTQTLTNKTLTSPVINTPTGIAKADVGLGSVDNTTDAAKPVSTAQQTALNLKAALISPTLVTPVLGVATATSINGSTIPTSKTLVVTTDKLSVHAATTSAELAGVISDETGTGALVFGTSPTLTTPAIITAATFNAQAELRLADSDSSHYVGFKSPATVTTNKVWTLPSVDGSANQLLSTDGAATLQWATGLSSSLNQYNISVGDSANTAISTDTSLLGDARASRVAQTFTITLASPGVATLTAHGFSTGDKVYLTTTGALPTGLAANTTYFIFRIDANSFRLATTYANALAETGINTSVSQSGTHTVVSGGIVIGLATSSQKGLVTLPNAMVRANVGAGHGSTNTKIRRFTNFVTTGTGITGVDSGTLGTTFTINEAGVYGISYSDRNTTTTFVIGLSLNSANLTTNIFSLSAAERLMNVEGSTSHICVSATVRLAAGDIIRAHTNGTPDATSSEVQLIITQITKL